MRTFLATLLLIFVTISGAFAQNPIVIENQLPGTPASQWDLSGLASTTLEGFATDISVNHGSAVNFKIKSNTASWKIDIYRLGYYQGNGARLIATINKTGAQAQPTPIRDATTGLVDAGNWSVTASWAIPASAVSGVYIAHLVDKNNSNNASHIPFIVRADESTSDIVFQTSDTTWQAYNGWGGANLYGGNGPGGDSSPGRAYKVSYNRPIVTRNGVGGGGGAAAGWQDFVFGVESAAIQWLEQNGYDISYIAGVDTARFPTRLRQHKIFLSVGHDEYWDTVARANVEAARGAGVNLVFMSGNEVYWKTRWEPSIDVSATSYRTLVCYKESRFNAPLDPLNASPTWIWTGTWRDPRFSPPADGGRPENALTGTIFEVDGYVADAIQVPYAMSRYRFWRNTPNVANTPVGGTTILTENILGYEWDTSPDNGFAPPGLIHVSSTTLSVNTFLRDYGATTGNGVATHNLALYRDPISRALVFGTGTVFWPWGLSDDHDGPSTPTDPDIQQATVNILADMGAQPASLQPGLVAAVPSTDVTPPASALTTPGNGSSFVEGQPVLISGTASDAGGGQVAGIEVSVDGGTIWFRANGTTNWTYVWNATPGTHRIMSRATDDSVNTETPSAGITVGVAAIAASSFFADVIAVPDSQTVSDPASVELGIKFSSSTAGTVRGLRFWKNSINRGTHTAHMWGPTGSLLGSATFANETATGWQTVLFTTPVQIAAGTVYTASYHTDGFYSASTGYFAAPLTRGVLTAPVNAGVYAYSASATFPSTPYQGENYWVDVLFAPGTTEPPPPTAPAITSSLTASGTVGQPFNYTITASNSPSSFNATGLPAGLSVSTTTGVISGTPTAAGSFNVALSASNAIGTGTATLTLTIASAPPTAPPAITSSLTASGTVGQPFNYTITASNSPSSFNATGLPAGLSVSTTTGVISGTPTAAGSFNVALSASNAIGTGTATLTLTISPATTLYSLFSTSSIPSNVTANDPGSVELGVKFSAASAGQIVGMRFYKGPQNTGPHTASLWSSTGQLLANATFANETASGWQTVMFATPVTIAAGTTYMASYHSNGFYSFDHNFFAATYTNGPLTALASGPSGGNGTYAYSSSSTFPSNTYNASNYWVDILFSVPSPSAPPAITSSLTASGTVGQPFNYTITASNSPSSFNATGLPAGLSVSTTTGVISGTPTAAGSFNVALSASNAIGTGTATLTLTIASAPPTAPPAITSSLTASGTVGQPFNYTITASNSPSSFNAIGLPAGLSVSTTTGGISGTPTAAGSFNVALSASNAIGTGTATLTLTIASAPPTAPPAITSSLTASGTVGQPFNYTITASNSPSSFNATGLPAGLSVSTTTGVISGTPTAAGSFNVALSASNAIGTGTATLTLTIASAPPTAPPAITSSLTASGTVGQPFNYTITASNSPSSFNATGLPAGLSVSTTTGVISGTPTAAGSFNVALSASNAIGTGTATLTLTIASAPPTAPPAITSSLTASGTVGQPFNYTITASNSPSSFNATGLPAGLSVSTTTGVISGTPTAAGSFNVALSASNAIGTGTATLTLTIASAPPTAPPAITSSLTASGTVGQPFNYTITASNSPSSFNATGLPAGLSVSTTTGVISGTPTAAGSFNVALSASNAIGTGTATLTLTISPATTLYSLFSTSSIPSNVTANDPGSVELGVKFSAASAGQIVGMRFYKGPQNTGPHTASLWSSTGQLLANATFANETASGWQTVMFATPVTIAAGTTYMASYHSNGFYSFDHNFFAATYTNGPLTALASGPSGGNGTYAYSSSSTFPSNTYNASNYWVDVIFR